MRKTIRKVLPPTKKQSDHDRFAKIQARKSSFEEDRECSADRILGNSAIMQLLSVKLETEGEAATVTFLESLGCSDVGKVMNHLACL